MRYVCRTLVQYGILHEEFYLQDGSITREEFIEALKFLPQDIFLYCICINRILIPSCPDPGHCTVYTRRLPCHTIFDAQYYYYCALHYTVYCWVNIQYCSLPFWVLYCIEFDLYCTLQCSSSCALKTEVCSCSCVLCRRSTALSDGELLAMFDEADTDRSGALSWSEFKQALLARGIGREFIEVLYITVALPPHFPSLLSFTVHCQHCCCVVIYFEFEISSSLCSTLYTVYSYTQKSYIRSKLTSVLNYSTVFQNL